MSAAQTPKVLLVDDDPAVCEIVGIRAASQGWMYQSHGKIEGALSAILAFSPDVILLDRGLPDGDGIDILRALRQDAAFSQVPVIIVTSRGEAASRLSGFEAGAQDYVIKPFDDYELMARIGVQLKQNIIRGKLENELSQTRLHDRVRSDAVDMIMHDMRAPLATIKLALSGYSAAPSGMNKHLMEVMSNSVDTAIFMINDHLDVGAGSVTVHRETVRFDALFRRLEMILHGRIRGHAISLAHDYPPDLTVISDGALLFRVLLNFVGNAIRFSPPGGVVTVRAFWRAGTLSMEVVDQGPGIPDKKSLFTRGITAPSEDGKQGYGIGLKFCRMAAEALQGSIRVEDAAGGGSRFIFECPARESASRAQSR